VPVNNNGKPLVNLQENLVNQTKQFEYQSDKIMQNVVIL
jgi:hypothetical protein